MRNYILLLFILCSISCKAQTNELTIQDFQNIKINNVTIQNIKSTYGDYNLMNNYFNNQFQINEDYNVIEEYWIEFSKNDLFKIKFLDGIKENGVIKYNLNTIIVEDASINVFIKGKTIKVGDNISEFEGFNTLTYRSGKQKIVFRIGSEVIRISFDLTTNLITKIEYKYYNT